MPDRKLEVGSYRKLVTDIAALYEGARKALVEAYWAIGKRIVEVEQQGAIKAAYGSGLLQKLSTDLLKQLGQGFSYTNLKNMRRFYLLAPNRPPAGDLPWAHHVELLSIHDKKRRSELEKRATQDELDRDGLRTLVRHELVRAQVEENLALIEKGTDPLKHSEGLSPSVELLKVPKLGLLNAYQIKDPNDTAWPDKSALLFDHGFKGYSALTPRESQGLKAGDIVTSVKSKKGFTLSVARCALSALYTYQAYLESVIDGDTLWVVLDTGMRGISRQKLRLRGIDCPEIDTKEGQLAKKFVESVLNDVPCLTVLSSRNPTFDRYEADIFFKDKDGKEVYLNNLLLEKGYAIRVRG